MVPVIRAIRDGGITILMIEHVMQAVMSLAEHVYVLAQGRMIAEGTPAAIAARPAGDRGLSRPWRGRQRLRQARMTGCAAARGARAARAATARPRSCAASTSTVDAGRDRRAARHQRRRQDRRSTTRSPGVCAPWPARSASTARAIDARGPAAIVAAGLIHVPEGRRIFPNMTCAKTSSSAATAAAARGARDKPRARLRDLPAPCASARARRAGTLSGGEQQMLAIGRGLMAEPQAC